LLPLVFLITVSVAVGQSVAAGQSTLSNSSLQPGTPIERTLSVGQSHSYTINLEQGQFAQLIVDQHGIDVIVRVFSPAGRRLGEFDSPNGDEGPENITVVAVDAGPYRVEVAPLGQSDNPAPGRYEIKITELRKATEQELEAGKNQDQLKAKGRALIVEATQLFPQLHSPDTRAGLQMKAAQVLWEADQKSATKLFAQSADSVKEFIAGIEDSDDYFESYQFAEQLRQQLITALAPDDPEMALDFLHSTHMPASSRVNAANQAKQEQQLELSLVSQIADKDPKRAFQMAEATLKTGRSMVLIQVLYRLRSKDPELAGKLAHDINAKLMDEQLLRNAEAGYLAGSFLQFVRSNRIRESTGNNSTNGNLLSEDEFRDLFQKMLAEALSYSPANVNAYPRERDVAQNLINVLKQLDTELQTYAPDKKAALDEKMLAIQSAGDPQRAPWLKYQAAINEAPAETAMESINQAPAGMRESLYQQLANKVVQSGDYQRAKQIITEHISNPMQRQDYLRNLDQQAIYVAMSKGKVDDAIRLLSNFRPASERANMVGQFVTRIGPGLKRAAALVYLEQVRAMLDPSVRATDQTQMYALLQLARAFSRYDADRAFDIVDPLLEQFNDLSAAAITMNGFGSRYYRDGELIVNNGNPVGETANRLAASLAAFGLVNFDRSKALADRIHPIEVRLLVYLTMAQLAVQDTRGGVIDF
jgi:hypothetical protein